MSWRYREDMVRRRRTLAHATLDDEDAHASRGLCAAEVPREVRESAMMQMRDGATRCVVMPPPRMPLILRAFVRVRAAVRSDARHMMRGHDILFLQLILRRFARARGRVYICFTRRIFLPLALRILRMMPDDARCDARSDAAAESASLKSRGAMHLCCAAAGKDAERARAAREACFFSRFTRRKYTVLCRAR